MRQEQNPDIQEQNPNPNYNETQYNCPNLESRDTRTESKSKLQ